MWRLCRGAESKQARELALALALAQECASIPEIARAYERMASHRVAEARYEEAIAMARQAREMAEQLGLTDVISDALDTEAKAIRGRAGDWAMLMEAALESALSGGHEEQAGRAFARAYMWHCDDLRPEEAERCYGDAFAYCEEHDIGTFVVCLQGQRTAVLEQSGRWDECISLGHALLDQHRLSPWNRLRPLCSTAIVMARRREQGSGRIWTRQWSPRCDSGSLSGSDQWELPTPRRTGWRGGWTLPLANWIGCALSRPVPLLSNAAGWLSGSGA
jgi:tetratricopeptide (TPR) repeat protein